MDTPIKSGSIRLDTVLSVLVIAATLTFASYGALAAIFFPLTA